MADLTPGRKVDDQNGPYFDKLDAPSDKDHSSSGSSAESCSNSSQLDMECSPNGRMIQVMEDGGGSLWNIASLGREESLTPGDTEREFGQGRATKERPGRRRKVAILSIDGGGMRGVIPARLLGHMEEMIQKKTKNPDARIADYFDMGAGTSVGALLMVMLFTRGPAGRPLFRGTEAWDFMQNNASKIFFSPWWTRFYTKFRGIFRPKYSARQFEKVLLNHLSLDGETLTLKDALKPILLPCYDLSRAAPYLFTKKAALEDDRWNFRLWEILRGCCAAPGLFRPYKLTSVNEATSVTAIDGALVMNNPTAAAITHVMNAKDEFPSCRGTRDILLLSLGTGMFAETYEHAEVKAWGAAHWTRPVLRIIVDGIADAVDRTVSLAFSKEVKDQFLRLQVFGLPKKAWDESSDPSAANMERLTRLADDVLDAKCRVYEPNGHTAEVPVTNRERLSSFVDALIQEHEERKLDTK